MAWAGLGLTGLDWTWLLDGLEPGGLVGRDKSDAEREEPSDQSWMDWMHHDGTADGGVSCRFG